MRIFNCLRSSICLRKFGVALDVDLPGPAEAVEVVDVKRAEVDLQRVEDLAHRHAHGLDLGAVDVEVEPGRVGPEAGEEAVDAAGVAFPLVDDAVSATDCSASRPMSPRSSITILKPPAVPRPSTGGAPKTLMSAVVDLVAGSRPAEPAAIASPERLGLGPVVEVVEHHVHRAEVRGVGVEQDRLAGDGHRVADARAPSRRSPRSARITFWVRSTEVESGSWTLTSR